MPIANGQVMALALQSRNVILATWYANLTGGQASNYWTLPASQLYARIAAHYGPKTEGDYCSLPISYAYHDIYIAVGGVETRDYTWGEAFALANIYAALRGHQGSKGKIAGYRELGKQILLALIATAPVPVPAPNAPSNLVAVTVTDVRIDLSWTDNSTDEDGFRIERSTDNVNFTQIAEVGANVTTYQSTGLTADTQYYYRVRAYNTGGNSTYSNTANATTFLAETLAYAAASGATDLVPLNNLFGYIIGESLWNNFRIYPQKGAQNANAGSTVYGAGALTSSNGTLIGSPTWGADGITYNGTSQAMRISKFITQPASVTVWTRQSIISLPGAATNALVSHNQFTNFLRSILLSARADLSGNPYSVTRSSDGSPINIETYIETTATHSTSSTTIVAQWTNGGGRAIWNNNGSSALTILNGTPQTSAFDTSVDVVIAATLGTGNVLQQFINAQFAATAFLVGVNPTTTQRETITNLINAL